MAKFLSLLRGSFSCFNPIQDGLLRAAHGWGRGRGKNPFLSKIRHTYPTMMKFGKVIPYLEKIQKLFKSRDAPLVFC